MKRSEAVLILSLLLFASVFSAPVWAERVELVTYYPVAAGGGGGGGGGTGGLVVNGRLHVDRATVGPATAPPAVESNSGIASGQMFVEDRVGIGTAAPQAALHAEGGVVLAGGDGDVNGDGSLTALDALILTNYFNGATPFLNTGQRARADVTGDGAVTMTDWNLIFDYAAGGQPSAVTWQTLPGAGFGKALAERTIAINFDEATLAGRVGIGTIGIKDPEQQLEIIGNLRLPETGAIRAGARLLLHGAGARNTFAGLGAGNLTMTGADNAGVGEAALTANVTGFENTAVGTRALAANTAGSRNTAAGFEALRDNTIGTNNTAFGSLALAANTDGIDNTAFGADALRDNTTGSANTAFGRRALRNNTTASNNTAIGFEALRDNTTGTNNTAFGSLALAANTDGIDNTAFGADALRDNTTGSANTALGAEALMSVTTGSRNTAAGFRALRANTTGSGNIAVGAGALETHAAGDDNLAVGREALAAHWTGSGNTALGTRALASNEDGSRNTAVGYEAGFSNISGSGNIFIGHQAGYNETGSDKLYIHNSDTATPLIYGDLAAPHLIFNGTVEVYGVPPAARPGWAMAIDGVIRATRFHTLSDGRLKADIRPIGPVLDRIGGLRGVAYRWKPAARRDLGLSDGPQIGLIAQEVEARFPELVSVMEHGGRRVRAVNYGQFSAVLVEAFKELRQENRELLERLDRLEQSLRHSSPASLTHNKS